MSKARTAKGSGCGSAGDACAEGVPLGLADITREGFVRSSFC